MSPRANMNDDDDDNCWLSHSMSTIWDRNCQCFIHEFATLFHRSPQFRQKQNTCCECNWQEWIPPGPRLSLCLRSHAHISASRRGTASSRYRANNGEVQLKHKKLMQYKKTMWRGTNDIHMKVAIRTPQCMHYIRSTITEDEQEKLR